MEVLKEENKGVNGKEAVSAFRIGGGLFAAYSAINFYLNSLSMRGIGERALYRLADAVDSYTELYKKFPELAQLQSHYVKRCADIAADSFYWSGVAAAISVGAAALSIALLSPEIYDGIKYVGKKLKLVKSKHIIPAGSPHC